MKGSILPHSLKRIASEHSDFQNPILSRGKNTTILVDPCHLLGHAKLEKSSHIQRNHMSNSHDQGWQLESSHQQNWKIKWVTACLEASGNSLYWCSDWSTGKPYNVPFYKNLVSAQLTPPCGLALSQPMWLSQHGSLGCCWLTKGRSSF